MASNSAVILSPWHAKRKEDEPVIGTLEQVSHVPKDNQNTYSAGDQNQLSLTLIISHLRTPVRVDILQEPAGQVRHLQDR